ncbi:MAG: ferritin family protein [Candidatus Aminicenantes bacterium]|nr:ferritin family protein [Candidatus Aminicenantes bacterium]
MSLLNARQLVHYAVRLEENGERFYRRWAKRVENPEQKAFFMHLAEEEVKHRRLFESLAEQVRDRPMDTDVYGEYMAYMQGFVDDTLFNEKVYGGEMEKIDSLAEAVEFAMRQELDSVLFYLELKTFVPSEQEQTIETIVTEERRHYATLLKFKRDLNT